MSDERPVRRIGRPPLTDRAALLAAARGIGFAELTVGSVTAAVGVKYSTFYRHFPSLDALVTALVDTVCEEELELPPRGPAWQDTVLGTCEAVQALLDRYSGMAAAVVALPRLPARIVEIYRQLTEILTEAGFDAERAALGAVCALETVTVTELTTPGPGRSLPDRQREIETADPPLDIGVLAATAKLVDQPPSVWTSRKIQLLIRGLEADLAAASAPAAAPELVSEP
ncbi:MAG: TetR/AcrR family transcriptional regulator [Actinomycetota bacterium]|nr:TetR/AcrR family transcriptional regulator [Actinomycetota bacterium]